MSFFLEAEDLSLFLGGEFSTVATILDSQANLLEISGIFDLESELMFDATSSVEGRRIEFLIKSVDAADLNHGDRLLIENTIYEIVGIEPKADGKITDVILKKN